MEKLVSSSGRIADPEKGQTDSTSFPCKKNQMSVSGTFIKNWFFVSVGRSTPISWWSNLRSKAQQDNSKNAGKFLDWWHGWGKNFSTKLFNHHNDKHIVRKRE